MSFWSEARPSIATKYSWGDRIQYHERDSIASLQNDRRNEKSLGAKNSTKPVTIVDIIVIGVGTSVVAGYPGVIVVNLTRKPLFFHFQYKQSSSAES